MSSQIQKLQEQVDGLLANFNNLQRDLSLNGAFQRTSSVGPLDPQIAFQHQSSPQPMSKPRPRQRYSVPATSAFDFEVTNTSMQAMGIPQPGYEEMASIQGRQMAGSPIERVGSVTAQQVNSVKDPLWSLNQEEASRLCRVYQEEVGSMYPMLNIEKTLVKAKTMFHFLDSMRRVGLLREEIEQGDSLDDEDTLVLKMILATALTIETGGHTDLGRSLFENVRRITNSQDRMGHPATIKSLQILVITVSVDTSIGALLTKQALDPGQTGVLTISILQAQYYFQRDEEVQSYRMIGLAARVCFELGLHRSEEMGKMFTSEDDSIWLVRLFWVIYVLDRRWSFGTGMPFAMQDGDIDPQLPEPVCFLCF